MCCQCGPLWHLTNGLLISVHTWIIIQDGTLVYGRKQSSDMNSKWLVIKWTEQNRMRVHWGITTFSLCRCLSNADPLWCYFLRGWARRWRFLCLDPEESLEPAETTEGLLVSSTVGPQNVWIRKVMLAVGNLWKPTDPPPPNPHTHTWDKIFWLKRGRNTISSLIFQVGTEVCAHLGCARWAAGSLVLVSFFSLFVFFVVFFTFYNNSSASSVLYANTKKSFPVKLKKSFLDKLKCSLKMPCCESSFQSQQSLYFEYHHTYQVSAWEA